MDSVTILFIGDVVAAAGLATVLRELPLLVRERNVDVVVANGENVAEGKGIVRRELDALFGAGVHVVTSGNHIWEKWQSRHLLEEESRLLRPHNYPRDNPGSGTYVHTLADGTRVGVVNIQGRVFLQAIDCPFKTMDRVLATMARETPIILVDVHAEATAEKVAMGWYLDGKVSAVVGTHTHIATADERILPGGTAYITDVGMSGPYDSVVGLKTEIALRRFLTQTAHKFEPAEGDPHLSGVVITVDRRTGRAQNIERVRRPRA